MSSMASTQVSRYGHSDGFFPDNARLGWLPDLSVIYPAVTLIIVRDSTAEGLEVLLLQRAQELRFAPGCWVFPGGRVEPEDIDHDGDELRAARRAAVREAREEAGMNVDEQLCFPYSYWLAPPSQPRRFSTHFFAAHARAEPAVRVDQTEIVDARWIQPNIAIEKIGNYIRDSHSYNSHSIPVAPVPR